MRIVLVSMPWATVDVPSLALGILSTRIAETMPDAVTETVYANLDFVDWASEKIGLDGAEYSFFAEDSYFTGCGDWVFSSALYGDRCWRNDEFDRVIAGRLPADRREVARRLHELAPDAIEHLTGRILQLNPDLVGFTSTFQQNTASLAAARRLKELAPAVTTVFGGANCDGAIGRAIHRNFPFVDHVVRGEGEVAFPALLDALVTGSPLDDVAGLCHRAPDGTSVVNDMPAGPLPPGRIAAPDYTAYFDQFDRSIVRNWADPKITLESSRGCWWGEKHHCTFCGLNGSFMQFRGKRPDVFLDEITAVTARHRVLDVIVVDNILEMAYLNSFLPSLQERALDLRIHYEIKANLRRPQVQALYDAGIVLVQPGIESLSSRVLKIMDKGVTGCQNVRLLRDAETVGLAVSWNYLYGFPGERETDYTAVIEQLPALYHLPPPSGCSRIGIERFSPYFERRELGFDPIHPASQYAVIYDLPDTELNDLAYLFDAPDRGIPDHLAERLSAALTAWGEAHHDSRLTQCDLGDRIVLTSARPDFDWSLRVLQDPVEVAAFRLLEQPRTSESLARKLSEQTGRAVPAATTAELLARWQADGLVFDDAGQYVHIVPEATNRELTRRGHIPLRSRDQAP
ncbi:RiPP maturation radical SAM C-methyltransferase [Actinoplanes sp. NPDC049596]|uniref:RiPP maturation radical SAM C-methyltransferase n=1 Tax=unclassified Actinoplanes TaxID=2626549 RepID=UPI0034172C9E